MQEAINAQCALQEQINSSFKAMLLSHFCVGFMLGAFTIFFISVYLRSKEII
jgi:hypothetical protein